MRDSGIARNIFEGLSIVKVVHAKILSDHIPLITIACAMTLDLDVKIRFFLFCFVLFFYSYKCRKSPQKMYSGIL